MPQAAPGMHIRLQLLWWSRLPHSVRPENYNMQDGNDNSFQSGTVVDKWKNLMILMQIASMLERVCVNLAFLTSSYSVIITIITQ